MQRVTYALRSRRSAIAVVATILWAGLLAASASPLRAEAIEARAECIGQSTFPGFLRVEWGYSNPNISPVPHPIGPNNFFTPPPASRGQPTEFLNGNHRRVFSVAVAPGDVEKLAWHLEGIVNPASLSLPQCDPIPLSWQGGWDPQTPYFAGNVVSWAGSSWAASSFVEEEAPGEGSNWELLAAKGDPGPPGEPGPPGPQGPQGAAPADDDWAAPRSPRFNRRGRAVVRDPHIKADSLIVIQYADPTRPGRLRPTNVLRVNSGRFFASGEPRTRFRYVVYRPGS